MKAFRLRGVRSILLLGAVVTLFCIGQLSAAPITGGFGQNGPGVLVFRTGGANFIDWCPVQPTSPTGTVTQPLSCGTAAGNNGQFLAQGGTGTFTPQNPPPLGGQNASIKDITDTPGNPNFSYLPTIGTTALNNFIILTTQPQYNFQAQQLLPALPALCGAAIGPFCLSQVGTDVSVTMTVNGMVFDTTNTLTPASFTDIITGQFNNTTIATVAANAQTPTGVYSNTWSSSLTTSAVVVPEPATAALIGSALIGIGILRRRRRV